jgi:hypothetical protein
MGCGVSVGQGVADGSKVGVCVTVAVAGCGVSVEAVERVVVAVTVAVTDDSAAGRQAAGKNRRIVIARETQYRRILSSSKRKTVPGIEQGCHKIGWLK